MEKVKNLLSIWREMLYILSGEQKKKSIFVILLMLGGTILELLGIAMIVPLMDAFIEPQHVRAYTLLDRFFVLLNIQSDREIILFISIVVILMYIFKNAYLIWLSYKKIKFQCEIEKSLANRLLNNFIRKEYEFYLHVNSAEILRMVDNDTMSVYQIVSDTFDIIVNSTLIAAVSIYIFATNFKLAVMIILIALGCVLFIYLLFEKSLAKQGMEYLIQKKRTTQYLLQMIEGIKEVLLSNKQEYFSSQYYRAYEKRNRAEILRTFAGTCPGYLIEGIFVFCFVLLITGQVLESSEVFVTQLPFLASFAVAAFKILPLIAKVSGSLNSILFNRKSLKNVSKNIQNVKSEKEKELFKACEIYDSNNFRKITLENVSYKYEGSTKYILNNIYLQVEKGKSVAIIGVSGAGKSTLVNLILGLLVPDDGKILLNDEKIEGGLKRYQNIVGYVPQSVFLLDDTIRNNIAFGEQEIEEEKIWESVKKAQLFDFITDLPMGLDTVLGERGVRISGGQRQRIAIARALYHDPAIMILDEATAALDDGTEKAVMDAIEKLHGEKTMLIVAHRLSTIKKCDEIYEVKDGKLIWRSKEEVIG